MTRSDRSLLKLNIPSLMALALLVASMMAQVQAPKAPKASSTTTATTSFSTTRAATSLSATPSSTTAATPSPATTRSGGLVFSQTIGGYKYTCNIDANLNPYADCLNIMAFMCNSTKSAEYNAQSCRLAVDQIFGKMSTYWQNVRTECGQWPWYEFTGNPSSAGCAAANLALQQNGYYLVWNPLTRVHDRVRVTAALTNTLTVRVWNNIALKEAVFCGESATMYPPTVFPPFETSDDCLASGPAPSLEKRTLGTLSLVFTYTAIRGYIFTCHTDKTDNPSADCLNTVGKICSLQPFDKKSCRDVADLMFGALNQKWQTFRKECGSWPWNGVTGDPSSEDCNEAKTDLETNTFYLLPSQEKVQTFPGLTDSIIKRLWKNPDVIG